MIWRLISFKWPACYTQYITEQERCFIVECSFLICLHADLERSSWWFGLVLHRGKLLLLSWPFPLRWTDLRLATWELGVKPAGDGVMKMLFLSSDWSSFGYGKGHHTISIVSAWWVKHHPSSTAVRLRCSSTSFLKPGTSSLRKRSLKASTATEIMYDNASLISGSTATSSCFWSSCNSFSFACTHSSV